MLRDLLGGGRAESEGVRFANADEARRFAQRKTDEAEAAAQRGDAAAAFSAALAGWQAVQQYPDDPACRHLAGKLMAQVQQYGEQANVQGGVPPRESVIVH